MFLLIGLNHLCCLTVSPQGKELSSLAKGENQLVLIVSLMCIGFVTSLLAGGCPLRCLRKFGFGCAGLVDRLGLHAKIYHLSRWCRDRFCLQLTHQSLKLSFLMVC